VRRSSPLPQTARCCGLKPTTKDFWLGIALPLAAVVFTFSLLQSFFQDAPEEDYFRIMGRFGITIAILRDYRSLFDQFNQLSSDLARRFGDPNSFQSFFQQIQSQFTSLGGVLAFAANMFTSIVPLLTLLSAVILDWAFEAGSKASATQ
jgi:hypothetical protein